jgi:hypothetical protein
MAHLTPSPLSRGTAARRDGGGSAATEGGRCCDLSEAPARLFECLRRTGARGGVDVIQGLFH